MYLTGDPVKDSWLGGQMFPPYFYQLCHCHQCQHNRFRQYYHQIQQQQQQHGVWDTSTDDPFSFRMGLGSPRTPQYASSPPDPLLISPQAGVSPSSGIRQQQGMQVSPQYSQGAVGGNFGSQGAPSPFPGPALASGAPSFGSMTQSTASALHDFNMQLLNTTLKSGDGKNLQAGDMAFGGSSKSKYVKQELQKICNARSEKQQQQQQQQSQVQQMDFENSSSELPLEILETINNMSQEHGMQLATPIHEDDVVMQARKEAQWRYNEFRKLSSNAQQEAVADPPDEAQVKATSLFRNQLMTPGLASNSSPSPSTSSSSLPGSSTKLQGNGTGNGGKSIDGNATIILQGEPRTPVEDTRPSDSSKNSLLCQLLSE